MKRAFVPVSILVVLLASCGGVTDNSAVSTSTTAERSGTSATTTPAVTTHPRDDATSTTYTDPMVAFAVRDLAERKGLDAEAIVVESIDEVMWRDGSLGCPLPGLNYTQALVDGVRIVLAAGGQLYEYHSGAGKDPFFCANPS